VLLRQRSERLERLLAGAVEQLDVEAYPAIVSDRNWTDPLRCTDTVELN
jgi:hypothetical protein